MLKQLATGAALGILVFSQAMAQNTTTQVTGNEPSSAATFLQQQSENEWRASKLIGTKVLGTGNQTIGEISDLVLDQNGNVKAAVIGVGGFLGLGEKNVAVPFNNLSVTRGSGGTIDKISLPYSKDQLNSAPHFKYISSSH